jgi:hypothetical protein
LSELPGRARKQFRTTPDEWQAQIERRIRAFDQDERGNFAEPADVSPEFPSQEDSEPAPGEHHEMAPDSRSIPAWRGAFIAIAVMTALAAVYALLFWR